MTSLISPADPIAVRSADIVPASGRERRILYVDLAYTLETVRRKGHINFFETRHSGGYFARVWGVHPLADIAGSDQHDVRSYQFSARQTIIEGVSRSRRWPRLLAPVDFLLTQAALARRLTRLIRDERIDLIFATDAAYGGLLATVLKKRTGRPLAIGIYANLDFAYETARTLIMPRLLPWRWLQDLVVGYVLRRADLVIGGTQNYLDYGVRHGAGKAQQAVIPIARNIEPCHLSDPAGRAAPDDLFRRLGVPATGRYLIMVSRLKRVKFADEGVRAMIAAAKHDPRTVGIVAGDGPLQQELMDLAQANGVADRVVFVGHLSQEELSRIVPHCITISPLTGMALVETGLGGSPAVAFDVEWQPEFVQDGVNGYVVPLRDHDALAEKALDLLNNDELRARMSLAMRRHALQVADRERIGRTEREVFARLLGETNSLPAGASGPRPE